MSVSHLLVRRRWAAGLTGMALAAGLIAAVPSASTSAPAPSRVPSHVEAQAALACPWMNTALPTIKRTRLLLKAMSTEQKAALLTGQHAPIGGGDVNPSAAGATDPDESLCLPPLVMADNGAGIGGTFRNTTVYPQAQGQAASFDRSLARRFGIALGQEAVEKGVNVQLAPGVNVARNPLSGRNFEYGGEDPFVNAQTAVQVIKGIQTSPVVSTVKHFILNTQETNRTTISENADARTMHEIYLPPFEAAVKKAKVGAVMCAYNKVNSHWACENRQLLKKLLRRELKFKGWVMSDWLATHSTVKSALNGLDQEMPGNGGPEQQFYGVTYFGDALVAAVEAGDVPMRRLNSMTRHVLRTMFRRGLMDNPPISGEDAADADTRTPERLALAQEMAVEGAVLLKNRDHILPLVGSNKTVAVIGPKANAVGVLLAYHGVGSGHVPQFDYAPDIIDPLSSITERAALAGDVVVYNDGTDPNAAAVVAAAADVVVLVAGNTPAELVDQPDLSFNHFQCDLITGCRDTGIDEDALALAVTQANPNTIVVLATNGPVEMPWLDDAAAVLEIWFAGRQIGPATAALLYGDENPSGKLPISFPKKLTDGALRTPEQFPGVDLQLDFCEGTRIGYRWYDETGIEPLFPFGFGESYTTFGYRGFKVAKKGKGAVARFTVTNTGDVTGATVPQVYVGQPRRSGEPPKALAQYAKVELAPGQSRTMKVRISSRAFKYWSAKTKGWERARGQHKVMLTTSAEDIVATKKLTWDGTNGEKHGFCGP
jgi:beta-glucosidase